MANPQKENGHLDIANEIGEAFQILRLSGREWQVLWVILRQTYGWNKTSDRISHTYFSKKTGIARRNIDGILKKLLQRNVIIKNDDNYIMNYGLQKNHSRWKDPGAIIKTDDGTIIKTNDHNNHITTNTNTRRNKGKDKIIFDGQKNQFININGHLKIFKEKFPCINIEVELRAMEAWLYANPTKRKKNYEKFIVNWLSNAQPSNTETKDEVVL